MNKAYSYHTFIFPFIWHMDKTKTRRNFEACLNGNWTKIISNDGKEGQNLIESYNQYRYFNAPARRAIYSTGEDADAVWNYEYALDKKPSKEWEASHPGEEYAAKYVIHKDGEALFSLHLTGIRLKLYASGIGVLLFETENRERDSIADFNRINDMGRHIYRPYIVNEEGTCPACPDAVSICYPDEVLCDGALNKKPDSVDEMTVAEPILYLLSGTNARLTIGRNGAKDTKNIHCIEPVLDERMFVAAYYVNAEFVDACTKWETDGYHYQHEALQEAPGSDENLAAKLYRTLYVDGTSFTTCQHRPMMNELLDKVIYKRWIEMGTITGVTDYSMISVTNCSDEYLLRNFRTEYVEMITLVLAQRASLRNYENMISNHSAGGRDINDIHGSYITFQSQLLLNEVTSQQQGIELYNLMRRNLFIGEQVSEVEKHLEALFTQKSAGNESRENLILFIIAVVAVIDPMNTFSTWLGDSVGWIKIGIFALGAILATGLYLHKRK